MTDESGHLRAERFDFAMERTTAVLICARVRDGAPILHVSCNEEGDWQFLCGGQHGDDDNQDEGLVTCLECLVARHPELNDLADLCADWSADRPDAGSPWVRSDHLEEKIWETVESHGWFVLQIEAEADQPGFSYTIGLHKNYGHPELIIVGLRLEVMHALLNICGDRIKAGERLPVGQRIADVLDDYDVQLRPVTARESYREHVGYALWFNQGHTFPLLQLVWPDKEGRFPGEEGAAAIMATQQPLLP